MGSLDKWLYNFARRRKAPSLGLTGESDTVGATAVTVLLRDGAGRPILCSGTSVPTGAGYAKGCLFIKTDVTTGSSGLYDNQGTTAAASFQVITGTTGITTDLSTITSTVASGVDATSALDSTALSQATSGIASGLLKDSVNLSVATSQATSGTLGDSVVTSKLTSEITDRGVDESTITSKVTSCTLYDSVLLSALTSGDVRNSVIESKILSGHP